ncbi:MAG: hypothetical protein J6W00_12880 [Lentisphaeria bacterium]|nr:hypothetical protein [Lentisphaeria bacterium]
MKIKFGLGRRCINPELPISLAGYFNKRMWDKVLDDLEVRAVVLKSGGEYAAIIQFDLLCINYRLYHAVEKAVKKADFKNISMKNLLICATHTHTAPDVNGDPNSEEFVKFAAGKAVEALEDAAEELIPGELFGGMAEDHRFIFNRRYWMKDGKVVTNPGKLNPDIVRPEGEIDPQIPLLAIKTEEGMALLISSIVNHTDTIGGCGVSADWPGFMRRNLEKDMAPGAMVLPLIGASGNINHFDVSTDMDQTSYAEPERIGNGYAQSIRKVWENLVPVEGKGLSSHSRKVKSKCREIDPAEIAEAEAVMAKYPDVDVNNPESVQDLTSEDLAKGTPFVLKYFANALLKQAARTDKPEFLLSCIKFGDSAVIASLPSEPFVEIGLALRRSIFNDRLCLVTSHGNSNGGKGYGGGYIPNSWNYGRGGYESTPRSSGYSIHTADILLANWRKLSEKK